MRIECFEAIETNGGATFKVQGSKLTAQTARPADKERMIEWNVYMVRGSIRSSAIYPLTFDVGISMQNAFDTLYATIRQRRPNA